MSEEDFSVHVPPVYGIIGEDMFNQSGDCFNQLAKELSGMETLRTDFVADASRVSPYTSLAVCCTLP